MAVAQVSAVVTAKDQASSVIRGISNSFQHLGQTIGAVAIGQRMQQEIGKAVTASNKLNNSLIGLGSVAGAFGQSAGSAQQAAQSLAADGLMPVNDAATGLKNLLATGFSLDQSVTLMNRFKDSASFGRQSALEFGEAIASATEGIKNGNCLVGETLVLTEGGVQVPIGQLYKEGKPVRVYSLMSDGSMRHTPISHVIHNGIKPVFTLTTNTGKKIRATGNHRFLTVTGWRTLDKLEIGEEILSINRVTDYNTVSTWQEQSPTNQNHAKNANGVSALKTHGTPGVIDVSQKSASSAERPIQYLNGHSMPHLASVAVAAEANGGQRIELKSLLQTGKAEDNSQPLAAPNVEGSLKHFRSSFEKGMGTSAHLNVVAAGESYIEVKPALGIKSESGQSVNGVMKNDSFRPLSQEPQDSVASRAGINGKVPFAWLKRIIQTGKAASQNTANTLSDLFQLISNGGWPSLSATPAFAKSAGSTSMGQNDMRTTSSLSQEPQNLLSKSQMEPPSAAHATATYTLEREQVATIELDTWEEVYDLSVPETRNFVANGLVVHNSILVDNAGLTKNLSVMLEEMGFKQNDVMRTSQDATVRMALFNGILKETRPQLGDAARLSETFSGAQARLSTSLFMARAQLGDIIKAGLTPLVGKLTEFLSKNQEVAVSLTLAVGAAAAFAVGLVGIAAAVKLVLTILGGPFTIILTAIAALLGVFVFDSMQRVQKQVGKTAGGFAEGADKMKKAAQDSLPAVNKEAKETAERLADIDEQMKRTTRDFREQLAQIVKDHRDKVTDLQGQLAEENAAFQESQALRTQESKTSNADLIRDHQDKVAEITSQLNEELIAGKDANGQRINDLRVRLAQENEAYNKQMADNKMRYEVDAQKAVESHKKKTSELQVQLDAEKGFLERHRGTVASIRNVQMLDEIQKLQRGHGEQMKEYDKQKLKVVSKSGEIGMAAMQAQQAALLKASDPNILSGVGGKMGKQFADALKREFMFSFKELQTGLEKQLQPFGDWVLDTNDRIENFFRMVVGKPPKKRAVGGPVSAQTPYIVGEEGPELFVPNGSGQIVPNRSMGAASSTSNVTINISPQIGVYAGTELEKRKLASELFNALQDVAAAKNMSVANLLQGGKA